MTSGREAHVADVVVDQPDGAHDVPIPATTRPPPASASSTASFASGRRLVGSRNDRRRAGGLGIDLVPPTAKTQSIFCCSFSDRFID